MERRREMGARVESVCWDDSQHLQHFREHRETYINQVRAFMRQIINGHTEQDTKRGDTPAAGPGGAEGAEDPAHAD
jgi:hypothetical protein